VSGYAPTLKEFTYLADDLGSLRVEAKSTVVLPTREKQIDVLFTP
jgi:hypothetical protein